MAEHASCTDAQIVLYGLIIRKFAASRRRVYTLDLPMPTTIGGATVLYSLF
jgi:hypothetical protein